MSPHLLGRRVSRWLTGLRSESHSGARRPRRLTVETLERRVLLDASGLPGDSIGDATLDDFSRFESAAELQQYLVDDALQRYDHLFGQPGHQYYPWYSGGSGRIFLDSAVTLQATVSSGSALADESYSETNTQVAGVDEGDIVETDGEYLYVLSGQEIVIIDALPAEEMHVASRIQIAGQPFEQYLNGDRLTVLSRERADYGNGNQPMLASPPPTRLGGASLMMIDVGYWPPEPVDSVVTVTVLDVSDREAPTVVQQTELDGNFVDSRAIDDFVYVVLSDGFYLPTPELIAVVEEEFAESLLVRMRKQPYGERAAIIGQVCSQHPGRVVIKTPYGSSRILDMLSGELLPRIC